MSEYDKMFAHVKSRLEKSSKQGSANKTRINYNRYEHIRRVYAWMERIVSECNSQYTINEKALHIATIFHDAGYGMYEDNKKHGFAGASICCAYMEKKKYDKNLLDEVVFLIENHSRKELLGQKDTPIELTILMEADLLDDTGAMGLLMDAMVQSKKDKTEFHKVYNHILTHSYEELLENPMVTEPAKRYWKRKQDLLIEFVKQLEMDLDIG